eukprot:381536-Amorphochlora_amoeboformis.AAC.3
MVEIDNAVIVCEQVSENHRIFLTRAKGQRMDQPGGEFSPSMPQDMQDWMWKLHARRLLAVGRLAHSTCMDSLGRERIGRNCMSDWIITK